ncbi:restriction endonuclease subunit S [Pseudomonas aeruginosa]|uniref:restriction endonuclease subunit S n=2 Tax=Pseudomonas aeruginosa TaxID=287 RepID=UPI0004457D82|nr:restriction endonuclease subunit S [Pseudomonas aeruginosa]SST07751.1 type I restriction-modification system, specificity subunit S [Acinetobacter baumannii]ARH12204.1 hypothetical protein HW10_30545 [Pseudomonas aeruginosa]AXR10862.1 restriction endonuclease subunit S [Pseudomonas aeruginosa]EYU03494.1 Type I restriction-modification system, specificity subunit S [Pseudomonas aeruginosa PA99]MBG4229406.1 restriction endonuclease subunit S [Pseudomonas aeruginosa]
MSSEWRVAKVEEIAAPYSTALATGPFGSAISSKYFVDSGVPVIRGSNLSADTSTRLIDADLVFVSHEKANEFQRSVAKRGDLVFTCWGTINQVGLIDGRSKFDSYIVSNKQMKLTINPAKADHRFIYYVFSGPAKQNEILENGIGSSVPGFNLGQLKRHEILLPPVQEQIRIADFLETLDDRIILLRETNATLEAIAQALFKSWFVDFDPVRAKAEGRQPEGIDATTAALFPDSFEKSELGLVPKGWSLVPFGELLAHTIGGDWGDESPSDKNDTRVAIIRGTDIPDLQQSAANRVPIRYTSSKKLSTRKLQDGDLVLEVSGGSKDQPTGRALYLTDHLLGQFGCPVEPASFCRLLRPASRDIGVLLGQQLTYIYSIGKTWEYQNQSTGIANFQTAHFLESELVVVPSPEVLSEFSEMVRPMIDRAHQSQIRELTQLRDTLLPHLISGQLRLPEAQALLNDRDIAQ